MEISTLLTIIGIIVSIIFGFIGIYFMFKRKYMAEITFVKEDFIGLFDSIVKNLPELSVLYKGQPVSQQLVLLKGALLNTGPKDISETMVEEKLSLNLPEKYKWLSANVVGKSPKVKIKINFSERILTFDSGLFKCNEFIRFEALAEVPIETEKTDNIRVEKKLEKAVTITHRIADTKKVEMREMPKVRESLKQLKNGLFVMLCATIALIFFKLDTEPIPQQVDYIFIAMIGVFLFGCLFLLSDYIGYKKARKLHKLISLTT